MNQKKIKRGTIRNDGKIFWHYCKGSEYWVTPQKFSELQKLMQLSSKKYKDKNREKVRESCRNWLKKRIGITATKDSKEYEKRN